jgi:hypothetical protein
VTVTSSATFCDGEFEVDDRLGADGEREASTDAGAESLHLRRNLVRSRRNRRHAVPNRRLNRHSCHSSDDSSCEQTANAIDALTSNDAHDATVRAIELAN